MRVCFFAPVSDRGLLQRVEFYRRDLDILRDLGYEVVIATRFSEIPWDVELYFVWWWTWAFLPISVALLRRRPVITTGVFDYRWPHGGRDYLHRPWWQRALLRWSLRCSDVNVLVSHHEEGQLRDELGVRNLAYCPLVLGRTSVSAHGSARENYLLCIATMHTENMVRKCIPQSIRAFAQVHRSHPQLRLVLAGDPGTGRQELADLCDALAIADAVDFVGIVSDEEKAVLLQNCAVYLQPTLYEGFGLAVLEAMSAGAAVISSPVGAVPELVGDAGTLVDGTSVEAIAAAISALLDSPGMRARLGAAAAARARDFFSYERRRDCLARIIEAVLIAAKRVARV